MNTQITNTVIPAQTGIQVEEPDARLHGHDTWFKKVTVTKGDSHFLRQSIFWEHEIRDTGYEMRP